MITNSTIFNCKIFIHPKKHINIQLIYYENTYYSLLETFKKHHIPVNYQCQSGYCGSCRIFLIAGKIKYYKKPLSYTFANEILLCCCYPIEDIVLTL